MQTNPEQTYVCKLISMFKLINSSAAVLYTRTEVQIYKIKKKTKNQCSSTRTERFAKKNAAGKKKLFYSAAESKVLQCSRMKKRKHKIKQFEYPEDQHPGFDKKQ